MTDAQRKEHESLPDELGFVKAGGVLRECKCGYDSKTAKHPNVACSECRAEIVQDFACVYAGHFATLLLVPELHRDENATGDRQRVLEMMDALGLPDDSPILTDGVDLAIYVVAEYSEAIEALADAVTAAGGVLEGDAAEQFLRSFTPLPTA